MSIGEGLQVLILGLGITLLALSLLILVIELINKLVNRDKGENADTDGETVDDVDETIHGPMTYDDKNQVADEELVAVISAAIATILDDGEQPFKIKNIRQIPASTPKWNQTGRREQLLNRR